MRKILSSHFIVTDGLNALIQYLIAIYVHQLPFNKSIYLDNQRDVLYIIGATYFATEIFNQSLILMHISAGIIYGLQLILNNMYQVQ